MSSKPYFEKVAKQWDEMRETFFSEAVREKAFAIAGVQPGRLAADIGAGTGFMTEGLIQRGLKVIAIDQSEAMLAEMRKKLGNFGMDYRLGEAESLPVPGHDLPQTPVPDDAQRLAQDLPTPEVLTAPLAAFH